MGVPVVTLAGENFISRNSASLLASAGLGDLVADTPRHYVEKAVALANDRARLIALRNGLRDRFMASPLGDGKSFTKNLEAAYREIWGRWRKHSKLPDIPPSVSGKTHV
jgi:predicted O-linked N-acetylglucosamine transferase (SPINDLY family)